MQLGIKNTHRYLKKTKYLEKKKEILNVEDEFVNFKNAIYGIIWK